MNQHLAVEHDKWSHLRATQFQPGKVANPTGRPKGARSALIEDFLYALQADFKVNGAKSIERCRTEDNSTYLKIVANLIPKEVKFTDGSSALSQFFGCLTVEQIQGLLGVARDAGGVHTGGGTIIEGNASPVEPEGVHQGVVSDS